MNVTVSAFEYRNPAEQQAMPPSVPHQPHCFAHETFRADLMRPLAISNQAYRNATALEARCPGIEQRMVNLPLGQVRQTVQRAPQGRGQLWRTGSRRPQLLQGRAQAPGVRRGKTIIRRRH